MLIQVRKCINLSLFHTHTLIENDNDNSLLMRVIEEINVLVPHSPYPNMRKRKREPGARVYDSFIQTWRFSLNDLLPTSN